MADNRNFVNKFANQGGGDIFVEDAKLSEISTKTAIASEGVMLKGTDGAYYEIDKASLSEVIRAELGAILADNSKNNGTSVAKVPTLNSSGNALGASSVADLASVLGALGPDQNSLSVSANQIYSGKYFARNKDISTYNIPATYGGLIAISVKDSMGGSSSIQFFIGFASEAGTIWVRDGFSGSGIENTQWQSWKVMQAT